MESELQKVQSQDYLLCAVDYEDRSESTCRESDREVDLSSSSPSLNSQTRGNSIEELENSSSKETYGTETTDSQLQVDAKNSSTSKTITHLSVQSDVKSNLVEDFTFDPLEQNCCSKRQERSREKKELRETLNSREINYGNGTKNHFQRVKTGLKKMLKPCKDRDDMMKKLREPGLNIRRYMLMILAKCDALKIKRNFSMLKKFLKKPVRPNTWKTLKSDLKNEIPSVAPYFTEIMSELLFGSEGFDDYRDWMDNNRMGKNMVQILQSVEYERLFRINMNNL